MYEVDTMELKIAMIEAKITTIESLSSATGVNRNTLSGVINGNIYPSSNVMLAIAKALNLESSRAGAIFFKKKLA